MMPLGLDRNCSIFLVDFKKRGIALVDSVRISQIFVARKVGEQEW